jgi:hypothetical protein
MRFMQFRAKDSYSLALSKLEKVSGFCLTCQSLTEPRVSGKAGRGGHGNLDSDLLRTWETGPSSLSDSGHWPVA